VLEPYFNIHFKREPTKEEFKKLLKTYELTGFSETIHPQISFYNNYEATVRCLKPKTSDFFIICKNIESLPFVDWIENYIYTGTPVPED